MEIECGYVCCATCTPATCALKAITARTTAAVEAMRERAAKLIERYVVNLGGNGEVKPLVEDRNGMKDAVRQAYAINIRALPVDGGDALDAKIREAYDKGHNDGYSCAIDLAQQSAERRGAERALRRAHECGSLRLADGWSIEGYISLLYPADAGKETTRARGGLSGYSWSGPLSVRRSGDGGTVAKTRVK